MEDWAARRDSRGELMVDALEMARLAADAAPGLVHDSGRGGQGSTRPGKVSATLWGTILGSGLGRVRRGSCHPRAARRTPARRPVRALLCKAAAGGGSVPFQTREEVRFVLFTYLQGFLEAPALRPGSPIPLGSSGGRGGSDRNLSPLYYP